MVPPHLWRAWTATLSTLFPTKQHERVFMSGRQSDRLASHLGIPGAFQFAAKQPTDSPRRAIDRDKQVWGAFLDLNLPEGENLGADPASTCRPAICADANCYVTHAPAEPAECES